MYRDRIAYRRSHRATACWGLPDPVFFARALPIQRFSANPDVYRFVARAGPLLYAHFCPTRAAGKPGTMGHKAPIPDGGDRPIFVAFESRIGLVKTGYFPLCCGQARVEHLDKTHEAAYKGTSPFVHRQWLSCTAPFWHSRTRPGRAFRAVVGCRNVKSSQDVAGDGCFGNLMNA